MRALSRVDSAPTSKNSGPLKPRAARPAATASPWSEARSDACSNTRRAPSESPGSQRVLPSSGRGGRLLDQGGGAVGAAGVPAGAAGLEEERAVPGRAHVEPRDDVGAALEMRRRVLVREAVGGGTARRDRVVDRLVLLAMRREL